MRSPVPFFMIVAISTILQCTFAMSIAQYKRDDTLLRGVSLGVDGVVVGVKSTVEGVVNPQTHGSRKDMEDAAAEAGKNVGGAIGSALIHG
ncbi:hypothetical protein [Parasitella parasitica]|uniref:Uncharacterized protein n=1 Tax=Parasitella parasitica TaxID=35722 RepID=A0A0B7MUE7_9FUNG|nr:hypothetical protein [Parasitella parasitica]